MMVMMTTTAATEMITMTIMMTRAITLMVRMIKMMMIKKTHF